MDSVNTKPNKPLGRKAYGSIPHLPGSRMGPADHHCHSGQEVICTTKARDKHDRIIVTEKLDGSCVAIAKIGGELHALGRAGYPAEKSPYEQHHVFASWVSREAGRFDVLPDGFRVVGEWLYQAHGTIYRPVGLPFVPFDVIHGKKRIPHDEAREMFREMGLAGAHVVHDGGPISVAEALSTLGEFGRHGAAETVEGVVYRVERQGQYDFLAKYVRPDKKDGKYLANLKSTAATEDTILFPDAVKEPRPFTGYALKEVAPGTWTNVDVDINE